MSKRKGNHNVMTTGPIDYGLHVILLRELTSLGLYVSYQLHPSIYTAFALNSFSHRRIIIIPSSLSYQLGHQSALALFREEVLCVMDYLQTIAFSNLVVVEQEEYPHALQKKAIRGATSKVVREIAGQTQPSLTFGTSTSALTIHHTTRLVEMTAE